ncbi:sugar ABC transporter permease, partial [Halorubrum sp. SS5]
MYRTIRPSSGDDEANPDDGGVRADGGVVSDGPAAEPPAEPDRDVTTRLKASLDRRFGSDFMESSVFWLPPFLLMGLFVYGAVIWNLLISLTDYQRFE